MTQKTEIENAFYSKYPNGSFNAIPGSRNYRFKVTFEPAGKVYVYIGGIVMIAQKLGLIA